MITSIELQAEGNGSVLATLSLQIEPTPPHQVPTKFNEFLKKVTDQFMKKTALPNTIGKELLIGLSGFGGNSFFFLQAFELR
jgi:hypothetical protein